MCVFFSLRRDCRSYFSFWCIRSSSCFFCRSFFFDEVDDVVVRDTLGALGFLGGFGLWVIVG